MYNKDGKLSTLNMYILLSISILLGTVTMTYYMVLDDLKKHEPTKYSTKSATYDVIGPYGDYIGGTVNPVIAFIAVIATGCAFFVQYKANIEIRNQFDTQQHRDNEQNFQNQLFKILDFHHNIVDNIYVNTSTIELKEFKYILERFPYDYFKVKENKYLLKVLKQEEVVLNSRHSFKFTCDLAEEVVNIIDLTSVNLKALSKIKKKSISETHIYNKLNSLNDYIKDNLNKEKIKIQDASQQDYLPSIIKKLFSHKQFSHYFTNLNRALKIINNNIFKENQLQKEYYYASIVRAQLSEQELKLIFLNSIIIGEAYKNFIENYSLLKNLNTDSNFFEKYEKVFRDSAYNRGKA